MKNAFTDEQVMLALAFVAYEEFYLVNTPLTDKLTLNAIAKELERLPVFERAWRLVWGPATSYQIFAIFSDSLMYVVQNNLNPSRYAVVIRGTNPVSLSSWILEDFAVRSQLPWPYTNEAPPMSSVSVMDKSVRRTTGTALHPTISRGTAQGLQLLQGLTPARGIPGAPLSLYQFLTQASEDHPDGILVNVAGHSLGGALAPALALWLNATRSRSDTPGAPAWDPGNKAKIKVYAYAGPSPGNSQFAQLYNAALGVDTARLWNQYDLVPHGWVTEQIKQAFRLYEPVIKTDVLSRLILSLGLWLAKDGDYQHVLHERPYLPGGEIIGVISSYLPQVAVQHTLSYLGLLDLLPYMDARRYFRFSAEVNDTIGRMTEERRRAAPEESLRHPPATVRNAPDGLVIKVATALKRLSQVPHMIALNLMPSVAMARMQTRQDCYQKKARFAGLSPDVNARGAQSPADIGLNPPQSRP